MNKKILAALAVFGTAAAFAAATDSKVIAESIGPDCYADGTQVRDGERYALVWSPGEFGGFKADGSLVNDADQVLVIAAQAKDGRCKAFSWAVPGELVDKGGQFGLYLLDTRSFADDGTVSFAAAEGATKVAAVAGAVKAAAIIDIKASTTAVGGAPVQAAATALPADAKQPTVKAVRVDDAAGLVYVTVENTEGYLAYDLAAGAKPDMLEGGKAQNPVTGGGEITLITPKQGGSGFFKVIRK